jgi:hypoxanthine phosphoribosyltransferase
MTVDHLEKLEEFNLDIDKKRILIVDDISDSGQTLKRYKKEGYTTATLDVRNSTVTVPDFYSNWIENADWIVYPWERKDSKTVQDYLDN